MTVILSIVLLLMVIGALGTWAHGSRGGYYPERGLAVAVLAVLVFWLAAYV